MGLRMGLAVLAASAAACAQETPEAGFSGEISLVLYKALPLARGEALTSNHLVLDLEATSGRWERIWGSSLGYNNAIHYGLVRKAAVSGAAVQLEVECRIDSDLWTRGGRAAYVLSLQRKPDGALEGTFEGTFKGLKVAGQARGELRAPRPLRIADYQPLKPGEHPRMLFRASDLPALRERLETPLGKAYLGKAREARDLISLGMLYRVARDEQAAQEALKIIQGFKGEVDPNPSGSGSTGHRLVEIAFCYDLCYEAWPEDFRKELETRIMAVLRERQRRLHPGHANYHPCSNYYGPSHGSAGLASLALWGEKGPPPVEPGAPYNVRNAAPEIPPAQNYRPGAGVPVAKFADGQMPAEWIYAWGFKPEPGKDVLAPLGGAAAARPEVGTRLSCGERSEVFHALSHEADKGYFNGMIDITNATWRLHNTTSCYYTVIENDAPRWVQLSTDYDPAEVYLGAAPLRHGAFAHLEKGLYPVMLVAPVGEVPAPGRALVQPRFREVSEQDARTGIAESAANYAFEKALYDADRQAWETSGGVDQTKQFFAAMNRWRNYWHYRTNIGDGGFLAESGPAYAQIGAWYPLVYAAAYVQAFGRDASAHPDVTLLLPRRMMQVVFCPDGTQRAQQLNSAAGFLPNWCAAAFPIVPDEYKPSLLWAWNWAHGVSGPETAGKVIEGNGLNMAQAFLNYPLKLKPVPPDKGMPLTWQASDFGFYCFRSGWQGKDEFIGQVFLKAKPVNGWNHGNAGAFALLGLGHEWTSSAGSRNGVRPEESVVWLPKDELNDSGCARLTYLKTEPDGSASMTFSLDNVYGPAAERVSPFDRNLIASPDPLPVPPVNGLRAMAFDYSGKSGAPCLVALVDRIRGGGEKLWAWQVPREGKKGQSVAAAIQTDGPRFTIRYAEASLAATFVAPAGAKVAYGVEAVQVGDPRHGYHGDVDRVKASGANPSEGEFFVIVTVQQKDAPAVKVEGQGLGARVTVGQRAVSFDGEKIVFSDAK